MLASKKTVQFHSHFVGRIRYIGIIECREDPFMAIANKDRWITPEEYLALEERAKVKHEYVDGRIYAMTGSTRRHNVITNNIYALLRAHLKGGPCQAYNMDIKVHVDVANRYYYPDVVVACDTAGDDSIMTSEPVLVAEVLSPSTSGTDRREKALAYRQLPSLQEYLVVHHRKKLVEMYRKTKSGEWEILQFKNKDEIVLLSMSDKPLKTRIIAFYEDTDIEHQPDLQVKEELAEYDVWACEDDDEIDEPVDEELDD
jgi:Uma2 family endonuclease